MSGFGRGVRVGAAVVALGFWVAGPQATGVAAADTTDGSSADAGAKARADTRAGAHTRTPNGPRTDSDRGERASRTGVAPAAAAANKSDRRPVPAAAVTVPVAVVAAGDLARLPAVAPVVAQPVSAPVAAAPVAQPVPAAGAQTLGAAGSLRGASLGTLDGGLNWPGLPGSPVADFMAGALLLARRTTAQSTQTAQASQTLVVSTLADAGAGSLRQAIINANAAGGDSEITFSVAGTIRVGATALPAVLAPGTVIDATTAPGYAGAPVVRIDFENTAGLTLAASASDSQILGLSLVDASGAGVTIAASDTIVNGNYIGLWGDGSTVEANHGDGILVVAGADGNIIGTGSLSTFVLANVISGNRGNGVTIAGGTANTVAANYIGTDVTGTSPRSNWGNGIQLTAGAAGNLIGGVVSGGNDPTDGVFYVPPQGNLISANFGNGVLIDAAATGNQLSGNFIGTSALGSSPLGNNGDGVAIVEADGNRLVGTTSLQNPFVFYNVVSGNRGNGLRITDSDNTVVHASFFGVGADNSSAVPNFGNGMLVTGNSQFVDAGGEIPLGNVMSGNYRNGIEVRDTAGGVISFNNFVGQVAFGGALPNLQAGIRITSSNPNFDPGDTTTWNRIRTSLVGGNIGNGIEFLGDAYGAEVTETAVGTTNTIRGALPNQRNGILIGDNANTIAIGGFQPSVEEAGSNFSVYSSGNYGYGIVFAGNAHDISVFDTRVGLGGGAEIDTASKLPNGKGGILIGRGTYNITIGGPRDAVNPGLRYFNEIVANTGNGVTAEGTVNLRLLGNTISGNTASGVVLKNTPDAVVGAPLAGNTITRNGRYGIYAGGRLTDSIIQSSTISENGSTGVRLSWARDITVGGTDLIRLNTITDNNGWGILATGYSRGTTISANNVSGNTRGNVNTTFTFGMTVAPPTVSYSLTQGVTDSAGDTLSVDGWQGLSTAGTPGQYLISGTTANPNGNGASAGLLYSGPITTVGGTGYVMLMPDQGTATTFSTTTYSADALADGQLRIVGTYTNTGATNELGFVFTGTVDDLATPANYTSLPFPTSSATWNVPHSTSGGLVVGNYDSSTFEGKPAGAGRAYIYDAVNQTYLVPNFVYPGSAGNTAYGIWWNGGTSYTIVGGYSNLPVNNLLEPRVPLSEALLVDFDSATGRFSNWTSYRYTDPVTGFSGITHFEGVSGVEPGKYTMAAVALVEGVPVAGFVTVFRRPDGSFGDLLWTSLTPPVSGSTPFADSVYGNAVVGIAPTAGAVNAYQAVVVPSSG